MRKPHVPRELNHPACLPRVAWADDVDSDPLPPLEELPPLDER